MNNTIYQFAFTGECEVCGKKMWERDRSYSLLKFKRVLCRLHSPFGTDPIHERYNMNDPKEYEEGNRMALAEGRAVAELERANKIEAEKIKAQETIWDQQVIVS